MEQELRFLREQEALRAKLSEAEQALVAQRDQQSNYERYQDAVSAQHRMQERLDAEIARRREAEETVSTLVKRGSSASSSSSGGYGGGGRLPGRRSPARSPARSPTRDMLRARHSTGAPPPSPPPRRAAGTEAWSTAGEGKSVSGEAASKTAAATKVETTEVVSMLDDVSATGAAVVEDSAASKGADTATERQQKEAGAEERARRAAEGGEEGKKSAGLVEGGGDGAAGGEDGQGEAPARLPRPVIAVPPPPPTKTALLGTEIRYDSMLSDFSGTESSLGVSGLSDEQPYNYGASSSSKGDESSGSGSLFDTIGGTVSSSLLPDVSGVLLSDDEDSSFALLDASHVEVRASGEGGMPQRQQQQPHPHPQPDVQDGGVSGLLGDLGLDSGLLANILGGL